jgi:hypothetical protein
MAGLLLTAVLAFAPAAVLADEGSHSLEDLVVRMADTPSDHAALAEHFRAKAAAARKTARRHESMARTYGAGKLTERAQMGSHCKKLAASSNAAADEYEALAKLHEQESKKPH